MIDLPEKQIAKKSWSFKIIRRSVFIHYRLQLLTNFTNSNTVTKPEHTMLFEAHTSKNFRFVVDMIRCDVFLFDYAPKNDEMAVLCTRFVDIICFVENVRSYCKLTSSVEVKNHGHNVIKVLLEHQCLQGGALGFLMYVRVHSIFLIQKDHWRHPFEIRYKISIYHGINNPFSVEEYAWWSYSSMFVVVFEPLLRLLLQYLQEIFLCFNDGGTNGEDGDAR